MAGLRSLGYVIENPSQVIANGHQYCELLRQGDSPQQADATMQSLTGADSTDTFELDSGALLAYQNCW